MAKILTERTKLMSAVAEQKQLIKGGAFLIEERAPEEGKAEKVETEETDIK